MDNNSTIQKSTFDFLKQLSANNNRDWFNDHKAQYEKAKDNAERFVDALIAQMNTHDRIETPSGKKACIASIMMFAFQKTSRPIAPFCRISET